MIRKKKQPTERVIDLTGPDGNAFVLLGIAGNFCEQLEIDKEPILKDMRSSDYEHLIKVFDKHFGRLVTLER